MTKTISTTATPATGTGLIDAWIQQDPGEPGRHNARFITYGDHVWAVLNSWRRCGDVVETAVEWGMPEEAIRAALAYYEQHRELFDAYFLLQDEEYKAWSNG